MKAVVWVGLAACFAACEPEAVEPPVPTTTAVSAEHSAVAIPVVAQRFAAEYEWQATNGSSANLENGVATISLKQGGMASAVVYNLAVKTGDTVTAKASLAGASGRIIRAVLIRHCEPETGEDAFDVEIALDGSEQALEVSQIFSRPYSCVRLSILSADGSPLDVKLSSLEFWLKSATAQTPSHGAPRQPS